MEETQDAYNQIIEYMVQGRVANARAADSTAVDDPVAENGCANIDEGDPTDSSSQEPITQNEVLSPPQTLAGPVGPAGTFSVMGLRRY